MLDVCRIRSKRRRKRGLPLVGDVKAASKDAKKIQTTPGKVAEASAGKDAKSVATGKPQQDAKKLHEADNLKTAAEGTGMTDQATEQLSLDDRSLTRTNYF